MRRPKILLAVPLLIAGLFLPALTAPVDPLPAGAIGMGHEGYSETVIRIHTGQRITFQNDSRWIHIIGLAADPITGAMPMASMARMGMTRRTMMQQNDVYTTASWNTPGTYFITCTVHPEMNATVVVTD